MYKNDKMHGRDIYYSSNGNIICDIKYQNDIEILKTKKSLLKDFISKIRNKKWKII